MEEDATMPLTLEERARHVPLKAAIDYLAAVCDGARRRDGAGFSGVDVRLGHWLARLPLDAWPDAVFERAWRLAQKYARQLQEAGMDPAALPRPSAARGRHHLAFHPSGEGFMVLFPYNAALIAALRRAFPQARFRQDPVKHFFLPRDPNPGSALLRWARIYEFTLGPGVQAALERPDSKERTE
uniref:Uncharacterized protein n=1 Tax=Thermogemmatispora argillosa TaxID=2045280 RepID=A0A455SYU6_9CHLR|nr:hypothetical protein KTA_04680 [Thermogemmatispora argillosa]